MAAGGDAIARDADGRVVFVTGALPGELVRARVVTSKKDYAKAVVVDVVEPSPDRVAAPCAAVAAGCGGCQWQHVALGAQGGLKRSIVVDALRRLGRVGADEVEALVHESVALPGEGYRTAVRLALTAEGRPAYRRLHSHDHVPVDDCLVLHPLLEALVRDGRWPAAHEVTLRCGARTGEVLVHPRPGEPDPPWFHEEAAGRRWRISAESFFQVRPDGADALAALVRDAALAGPHASAVDLYAGVGLFAGVLADLGARVTAVEGTPSAVRDAARNVPDAVVVEADVHQWRPEPGTVPVDVVVADPSRAGLGTRGADTVAACEPRTIVLVSCDPAALGRDTRLLAERGYVLERATPVDLFPHTFHVEVVSRFCPAGQNER